jgi:hypothetical protein
MDFIASWGPYLGIIASVVVGVMYARKCDCSLLSWAPVCRKK